MLTSLVVEHPMDANHHMQLQLNEDIPIYSVVILYFNSVITGKNETCVFTTLVSVIFPADLITICGLRLSIVCYIHPEYLFSSIYILNMWFFSWSNIQESVCIYTMKHIFYYRSLKWIKYSACLDLYLWL